MTNKPNVRHTLSAMAIMAAALFVPHAADALPAYPGIMTLTQPDNTLINVQLHGDEYYRWYTTEDGYPLVWDEDGYFYHARLVNGELAPTNIRATDLSKRTDKEKALLNSIDKSQTMRRLAAQHNDARRKSPMKVLGETNYPTTGNRRAIAILVDFPKIGDTGQAINFYFDNPNQLFSDMLNKPGFDFDGATGSVTDYYKECSSDKFNLTFDVFGPVTMSNAVSFYGVNEVKNTWKMVVEACQAIDSTVDFTQYDENKDGVIDNIYIFYAGQGEADGGESYTIYPHSGDINDLTTERFSFDGVKLNRYACSNEIRIVKDQSSKEEILLAGIGNVCHEFTHVLGFPDLYNTQDQSASFTPGPWDLMDIGSYNNMSHTPPIFSAYERMCMGWLTPQTLDAADNYILEPISRNKAYQILTPNENEIFILENRQQEGWDKYIPGHGMLIWHIAYEADRWLYNQVNTVDAYQCIDIEEADGIWSDLNRSGDVFPGTGKVTSFTDDTYPSMLTQVGTLRCETPITEIEERNGLIHFKVKGGRVSAEPVTALPATDVTPISFTANWEANPDAIGYKLDVWQQDGLNINYVDGYRSRAVDGTSCSVEGLMPENEYIYAVRVIDNIGESPASNQIKVQTGVATFEYIAPTLTDASAITASSFTANWLPLDNADGYTIDVYVKEKGEADYATADFTGGVKQLPQGWRTDCQMTVGTNGYFGKAAPALSMSADYNYIESPTFDDNIRSISFWYRERNNPSGDNQIIVSTLIGATWTAIKTIDLPTPPAAGTIVEIGDDIIPEGSTAVRIAYKLNGRGALALDDVTVGHNDNLHNVALPEWESYDVGNETSVTIDNLQANTDYYYTVKGYAASSVTIPSAEAKVTTLDPASVTDIVSTGVKIDRIGNTLQISTENIRTSTVEIYTTQGQLLIRGNVSSESPMTLTVANDRIYIVKVDNTAYKIAF